MLAELVDLVIGVDTHTDTHTAAVVTAATGALVTTIIVTADADGYAELVERVDRHGGLRAWAIEGTGGYGAGLARHLGELEEVVVELDRPARPVGAGRSRTRSMPTAPPAKHSPGPGWPSRRPARTGPPCKCC